MLRRGENHHTRTETYHLCILHRSLPCLCFHYKSDLASVYYKVCRGLKFDVCLNLLRLLFFIWFSFSTSITASYEFFFSSGMCVCVCAYTCMNIVLLHLCACGGQRSMLDNFLSHSPSPQCVCVCMCVLVCMCKCVYVHVYVLAWVCVLILAHT